MFYLIISLTISLAIKNIILIKKDFIINLLRFFLINNNKFLKVLDYLI